MLEEDDAILPVFRCPTVNTVNKINGIDSWTYEDFEKQMKYGGMCVPDPDTQQVDDYPDEFAVDYPDPGDFTTAADCQRNFGNWVQGIFQPCKNNCKGGMET